MGRRRLAYPCVSILTRLCFRMEGMTELINGTFIKDLVLFSRRVPKGKTARLFLKSIRSLKAWWLL
jgi:hypothetical protein